MCTHNTHAYIAYTYDNTYRVATYSIQDFQIKVIIIIERCNMRIIV